jgi:hypothetical protein
MRRFVLPLLAVTTLASPAAGQTRAAAGDRILVMPFDNPRRDSRIIWLG